MSTPLPTPQTIPFGSKPIAPIPQSTNGAATIPFGAAPFAKPIPPVTVDQPTPETPVDAVGKTLSSIGSSYSTAVPDFVSEAGKNDDSTSANPIVRTAEDALGATASGIGTVFSPITNALKGVADWFSSQTVSPEDAQLSGLNNAGAHVYDSPVLKPILDLFDSGNKQLQAWQQAHPEAARNLGNILTVGLTAGGGEAGADESIGSPEGAAGAVDNVTGKVIDSTVGKIAPKANPDAIANQIGQGKTADIPKTQDAITKGVTDASGKQITSPLDTSKVKTYADVDRITTAKIPELSKIQDNVIKAADNTPRKVQQLALSEPVKGGQPVIHNYVIDAVNNLKELYQNSNDPVNLAKINQISAKLDPIKGTGITPVELNQLARDYGTEFKSKAFKANGDPTTSVSGQAYESTRTGLKNTVNSIIKDPTYKAIDRQMSNIFNLRELSRDMKEKVNTAAAKIYQPNVLQRLGGIIGKAGKFLGAGDVISKMTGLDHTPGQAGMTPVEIEANLKSNIARLKDAIATKDDASFADKIKAIVSTEPKVATVKGALDNVKTNIKSITDIPNKQGGFARIPATFDGEPLPNELYHGTSKENTDSMIKNGFNSSLDKKPYPEAPDAFYVSPSAEDASFYGDSIVKATPKDGVKIKTMSVSSKEWTDVYGPSKSAKESVAARAVLKSRGYDAIDYGNEVEILSPEKFNIVKNDTPIPPVSKNGGNASVGALAAVTLAPGALAAGDLKAISSNKIPSDAAVKKQIAFRETGTTTDPYSTRSKNKDGTIDLGKYQINTDTLKTYSKEFLGKTVTPDQFVGSPKLQEDFMSAEIQHLKDLGVSKFDTLLALHHLGFSNISTAQINKIKDSPEAKKYINNKP